MANSGFSFSGYRAARVGGHWEVQPDQDDSGIEMILMEIERAVRARLYYLAVVMATTLPDICAALESSDGETSPSRFKSWYNANVATRLQPLTDRDMYSLRCGVVHQGKFGNDRMQFDRMMFSLPGPIRIMYPARHEHPPGTFSCSMGAEDFCNVMIEAVRTWYATKKSDPNVQRNLPNLVQFRPHGLAPFIVGMPVIA